MLCMYQNDQLVLGPRSESCALIFLSTEKYKYLIDLTSQGILNKFSDI